MSTAACATTIPPATCTCSHPTAPETARHLIFRDWLRSNPKDRALYATAKAAAEAATLASGGHVMDYNARKEAVLREIYGRAVGAVGVTG